jgi:hypothetical protein
MILFNITTFPGQSLSPKNMRDALSGGKLKIALFGDLSLEEAMDLSRDRQILELDKKIKLQSDLLLLTYNIDTALRQTCRTSVLSYKIYHILSLYSGAIFQ